MCPSPLTDNVLCRPTVVVTQATTLIDATPLASTPTHLPTLPTGDYGFPLEPPKQPNSKCLNSADHSAAWACVSEGFMLWNVTPSDVDTTHVSLTYAQNPAWLQYGPQPPNLPEACGLSLMGDAEMPGLGPAFFFQAGYTKQVILPGEAMNTSADARTLGKRSSLVGQAASEMLRRDLHVQSGDQPWVCNWNGTLVEGFIYIQQLDNASTATTALQATTTPSSWVSHTTSTNPDQPHSLGATMSFPTVPLYPLALKLAERRMPDNAVQPYCEQMLVQDDLSMVPLNGPDGKPSIVKLNEMEPAAQQEVEFGEGESPWYRRRSRKLDRRDNNAACLCEWMIT